MKNVRILSRTEAKSLLDSLGLPKNLYCFEVVDDSTYYEFNDAKVRRLNTLQGYQWEVVAYVIKGQTPDQRPEGIEPMICIEFPDAAIWAAPMRLRVWPVHSPTVWAERLFPANTEPTDEYHLPVTKSKSELNRWAHLLWEGLQLLTDTKVGGRDEDPLDYETVVRLIREWFDDQPNEQRITHDVLRDLLCRKTGRCVERRQYADLMKELQTVNDVTWSTLRRR